MLKRGLDLIISISSLLFLWPLFLLEFVIVSIFIGRPSFFYQLRPGLGGKPFRMIKFRTMVDSTDHAGNPLPDKDRLTPLGRFLRSSSLDELPELLNVIKGDMSLVGPRPLLIEYLPLYSPEQSRRHEVRPGITGWAQVNGRNTLSWEDKFELDVWYVDNQSVWLDLRILWLTVCKVVTREGISAAGQATMPKFTGS